MKKMLRIFSELFEIYPFVIGRHLATLAALSHFSVVCTMAFIPPGAIATDGRFDTENLVTTALRLFLATQPLITLSLPYMRRIFPNSSLILTLFTILNNNFILT
ncbi:hypothetical protein VB711_07925 [Cronbergia sp. UHCC 0137]|uniref:hypothetical protein n=1 Tax=Cronbergia sp. UHCC 0137 TaxID=3110239 RepID=UPI002B207F61|nr:hypothetical protein [Cronbergia sp. UHCC 0137]MEA5617765.1 hypothetical protein [Cronbergia sp. UHCC 0137]